MISPLGQRQAFQTAHVEAIRQAQDVGEQIQREFSKVKAAEDQLATEHVTVRVIPESEEIQTEERQEPHRNPHEHQQGQGSHGSEEESPSESEQSAGSAESHLDFLA